MAMDIRQPKVAALVAIGEFAVIDAELMQDGGVEVVDVHGAWRPLVPGGLRLEHVAIGIGNVIAVIISLAVGDARLDAATGHPDGETTRMMIAPIIVLAQFALTIRCAPKFSTPDNECVL